MPAHLTYSPSRDAPGPYKRGFSNQLNRVGGLSSICGCDLLAGGLEEGAEAAALLLLLPAGGITGGVGAEAAALLPLWSPWNFDTIGSTMSAI